MLMHTTSINRKQPGRIVILLILLLAVLVIVSPSWIGAHAEATDTPHFDVATIRVNTSHDNGEQFAYTADGFQATNVSLSVLLKMAYGVEEDQIVGLPGWAKSEHFDISAKAVGIDLRNLQPAQRKQMIRPLLADRFQFRFHEIERDVSAYVLVVSKNGSKLKPSAPNGSGPLPDHQHTLRMMGRGYVLGLGVPMELMIQMLTDQLGRPVIDRTDLKGNFDFALRWMPDERLDANQGREDKSQATTPSDSEWPTLFTALDEQLGLRLKAEKAPAGAIAIDNVAEPSAN